MSHSSESPAAEFRQLVDAHYRPLFRFAMSLCGSAGTASDLVQQTYYQWAAKGDQLRDRTRAKAWLFTTLHREFLQFVRRESRLVPLPDDHDDMQPVDGAAPEPAVVEDVEVGELYAALHEVDEVFRVALTLFYLQEFSYTEIADVLGVPIGTVMSRLARGKQHLRRRLAARQRAATTGRLINFDPKKAVSHG